MTFVRHQHTAVAECLPADGASPAVQLQQAAPRTIPYSPGPEQHVRAARLLDEIESAAAANTAAILASGHDECTTRFSSQTVPAISLFGLAEYMRAQTQCAEPLTLPAAILLIRYCTVTKTAPTSKTVHRMFLAALHVAIKTHSDRYFRNDAFALFAGITWKELNRLEAILLRGVHWRVLVHAPHVAAALADPAGFVAERVPVVRLEKKQWEASPLPLTCESVTVGSGRSTASRTPEYVPKSASATPT